MLDDAFLPISRAEVRDLWQKHEAADDPVATGAPWQFVHALFSAWRRADETRQTVLMGWTSPGAIQALQRGDGACQVHPARSRRGGTVPVGVLHHAPCRGTDER